MFCIQKAFHLEIIGFSSILEFLKFSPFRFREADCDDDIIFEDFARLRLKGEPDAWLRGSKSIYLFETTKCLMAGSNRRKIENVRELHREDRPSLL